MKVGKTTPKKKKQYPIEPWNEKPEEPWNELKQSCTPLWSPDSENKKTSIHQIKNKTKTTITERKINQLIQEIRGEFTTFQMEISSKIQSQDQTQKTYFTTLSKKLENINNTQIKLINEIHQELEKMKTQLDQINQKITEIKEKQKHQNFRLQYIIDEILELKIYQVKNTVDQQSYNKKTQKHKKTHYKSKSTKRKKPHKKINYPWKKKIAKKLKDIQKPTKLSHRPVGKLTKQIQLDSYLKQLTYGTKLPYLKPTENFLLKHNNQIFNTNNFFTECKFNSKQTMHNYLNMYQHIKLIKKVEPGKYQVILNESFNYI